MRKAGRPLSSLIAATALAVAFGWPLGAQSGPTFEDQERVTAVDLLVGLESSQWRALGATARLPADFDPMQLRLERAGEVRAIVSAEAVEDGRPLAGEPWTFVVFIDVAGSRSEALRWGAELLVQEVETLIGLGSVEVVVSAPEVQVVVPLTREANVLKSGLSQMALEVAGEDGLGDMRYAARRAELAADGGAPGGLDGPAALSLERARALRHQDELLTYVTERFADAGPRRCIFWLTGGFDIEPERFYGMEKATPSPAGWPALSQPDIVEESRELARTLAAYGWITAPMLAPPPDALRGRGQGKRVGQLRFLGTSIKHEENRRPERAEAYLELGAAHAGGERWQDAADSYERAYYFFGGDPRTKDRQAVALAGLGAALDRLGEEGKARRALELAAELDPSALPDSGALPPTGRLIEPDRPLRIVAGATSGQLVRSASELDDLLEDLSLRLRVTFQLPGQPTGELVPVTVLRGSSGKPLRAPSWTRFGVPARVDRALVRSLIERDDIQLGQGIAFGGREVLEIEPLRTEEGALVVRFDMGWPGSGPRPRGLRLSFAASSPTLEAAAAIAGEHAAGPPLAADRQWPVRPDGPLPALEEPVELALRGRAMAVIWRDLETGAWGGVRHLTGLE